LLNSENKLQRLFLYGAWVRAASILHSLLRTIRTNECTQFYQNHTIVTTQKFIHVSGLIGPSSERTQL